MKGMFIVYGGCCEIVSNKESCFYTADCLYRDSALGRGSLPVKSRFISRTVF